MRSLSFLFFVFFDTLLAVQAAKFPITARSLPVDHRRLRSRAQITGQNTNSSLTGQAVTNNQNTVYFTDLGLGGQTFSVLIDTGSSDLWIAQSVPNAVKSGKSASLSYAIGSASGDIEFADLTFDNYTVPSIPFVQVENTDSFSTNLSSQGYVGLLGLGPNSGSVISKTIGNDSGDSALDRIFGQNKTSQNFISILLDRANAPSDGITGQITISEVVSGFENVTSQPKIPVVLLSSITKEDQHFEILGDKGISIIGPDGQPISVDSTVPNVPDGQIAAVLDSGFTFSQVPREVSDAIYGRVQGAIYDTTDEYWTCPCYQYLNISFNFGGQNYPIHPLDTLSSDYSVPSSNGTKMCVGTFQPISSAFSLLGEYDFILGMGFLRNVYALMDYGDFVDDSSNDRGDPFIQLLSITNSEQAKQEFISTRLGGQDTTGGPSQQLLPASEGQTSPETDEEKKQHIEEEILSHWPYILLGGLILLALVTGLCVWRFCCRRRGQRQNNAKGNTLPMVAVKNQYRPLGEPAPPPVVNNDFPRAHIQQPPPYMPQEGYYDPYRDPNGR